jgi:dihydroflavonol-4-reductase
VAHVAAAIRGDEPRDQSLVVRPAVEGTERVLRFAEAAGVKRVVLTSSIATVGYGLGQTTGRRVYTEADFTNLSGMRYTWAYCVGKTRAEQLAWDFARAHGLELTTIHPGAIIGPALDAQGSISLDLVIGLMNGRTPAVPSNGFSLVDVRDVVALHVAALEHPAETAGQRYIAASDYVPFPEVARILAEAYPDWAITRRDVPDWIIRLLALFGGPSRQIINDIGNEKVFSGEKAAALLGRPLISGREAVLATARSAVALGLVQRRPKKAGR